MKGTRENTPHQKNLRKGRWSQPFAVYLITKCAVVGTVLTEKQRDDICRAVLHARDERWIMLHAFVVMQDHWHALVSLTDRKTLSEVVGGICHHARFHWRDPVRGGYLWQDGFHDHMIRPEETVADVVKYIEFNPVRKGSAARPEEWRWSSAAGGMSEMLDRRFLGHERWSPSRRE